MEKNAIKCLFRFKEIQSGIYAFNGGVGHLFYMELFHNFMLF